MSNDAATYLKDTADLMRERAADATPGPWQYLANNSWAGLNVVANDDGHPLAVCGEASGGPAWAGGAADKDAGFIAAFDPTVALALADFLYRAGQCWGVTPYLDYAAMSVALAYRRDDTPPTFTVQESDR